MDSGDNKAKWNKTEMVAGGRQIDLLMSAGCDAKAPFNAVVQRANVMDIKKKALEERPQVLQEQFHFYPWEGPDEVRLMCSWDTTAADVDAFVAAVRGA